MKIGYIRISKDKQTTALQEDAMRSEQCARVFTDKMSGKRFDRPEFLCMLDVARPGDVLIVWRLDRLGCKSQDFAGKNSIILRAVPLAAAGKLTEGWTDFALKGGNMI